MANIEKLGAVHSWNSERGFGIITPYIKGQPDVFCHASTIEGEGLKELAEGVAVAYTERTAVRKGRRRRETATVRALRMRRGVPVDDRELRATARAAS